jgi:hypothetical protein
MVLNFADPASHLRSSYRRGSSVRSQPAVALFLCHTYDTALSSCKKYRDNSCLSLLCDVSNTNTHYTISVRKERQFYFNVAPVTVYSLTTGQTLSISIRITGASVMCVQHSSSAKRGTMWTYVLRSAVINCLTAEGFSRTFLDV